MDSAPLTTVGWREWLSLPFHGIAAIKVKVDTGARTSTLHADDLERFERDGEPWVRFVTHPWQGSDDDPVVIEAPLLGEGEIRSSNGEVERRPVVRLPLAPAARPRGDVAAAPVEPFDVDVTLTDRSSMGFRMLLGRTALEGRFVVDPGASYLLGRPRRDVRRRNRGRTGSTPVEETVS